MNDKYRFEKLTDILKLKCKYECIKGNMSYIPIKDSEDMYKEFKFNILAEDDNSNIILIIIKRENYIKIDNIIYQKFNERRIFNNIDFQNIRINPEQSNIFEVYNDN